MPNEERIKWSELRKTAFGLEWFFLIAEENEGDLKLYESSTNEVRWFEMPWTSESLAAYAAAEQARANPDGHTHAANGLGSFLPISKCDGSVRGERKPCPRGGFAMKVPPRMPEARGTSNKVVSSLRDLVLRGSVIDHQSIG